MTRNLTDDILTEAARLDAIGAAVTMTTAADITTVAEAAACLRFARQNGKNDAAVLRRLTAELENRIAT